MRIKGQGFFGFRFIDLVPAIAGLIGKTSLVSSFAFVWAQELNISGEGFVFENVRIEIMIGSIITLLFALLLPKTSPVGTLSPLIIMIPAMAGFGVHPLMLSIFAGVFGIISVGTGLFGKLLKLSGGICRASLPLVFGIAGIIMSIEKLLSFFGQAYLPLTIILLSLFILYILLSRIKKVWIIIPAAAVISLVVPMLFGIFVETSAAVPALNFSPSYWWEERWGIGYGFDLITILKTLPFALFIVMLWAVDTVSINALLDANFTADEKREEMETEKSFYVVSLRNMLGGACGGAQTGALWRSFLIPLFMVKRPIFYSAFLMGLFGIIAGVTIIPIRIMSYTPLVWSVLLFGIFIPFFIIGIRNTLSIKQSDYRIATALLTLFGVLLSPIVTWIGAVAYERIQDALKNKR